jgi:hypothetical protein
MTLAVGLALDVTKQDCGPNGFRLSPSRRALRWRSHAGHHALVVLELTTGAAALVGGVMLMAVFAVNPSK